MTEQATTIKKRLSSRRGSLLLVSSAATLGWFAWQQREPHWEPKPETWSDEASFASTWWEGARAMSMLLRTLAATTLAPPPPPPPPSMDKDKESERAASNQPTSTSTTMTLPSLATSLIAAMTTTLDTSHRRAISRVGNGALVDWLLDTLVSSRTPSSSHHRHIETILTSFLQDDLLASELLSRPFALSKLLTHLARDASPNSLLAPRLLAAMRRHGTQLIPISSSTHRTGQFAQHRTRPTQAELEQLVTFASERNAPRVRYAACWALAEWAACGDAETMSFLMSRNVPQVMFQAWQDSRSIRDDDKEVMEEVVEGKGDGGGLDQQSPPPHSYAQEISVLTVKMIESLVRHCTSAEQFASWLPFLIDTWEEGIQRRHVATVGRILATLTKGLTALPPLESAQVARALRTETGHLRRTLAQQRQRFRHASPSPSSSSPSSSTWLDLLSRSAVLLSPASAPTLPPPPPPPVSRPRAPHASIVADVDLEPLTPPPSPRAKDEPSTPPPISPRHGASLISARASLAQLCATLVNASPDDAISIARATMPPLVDWLLVDLGRPPTIVTASAVSYLHALTTHLPPSEATGVCLLWSSRLLGAASLLLGLPPAAMTLPALRMAGAHARDSTTPSSSSSTTSSLTNPVPHASSWWGSWFSRTPPPPPSDTLSSSTTLSAAPIPPTTTTTTTTVTPPPSTARSSYPLVGWFKSSASSPTPPSDDESSSQGHSLDVTPAQQATSYIDSILITNRYVNELSNLGLELLGIAKKGVVAQVKDKGSAATTTPPPPPHVDAMQAVTSASRALEFLSDLALDHPHVLQGLGARGLLPLLRHWSVLDDHRAPETDSRHMLHRSVLRILAALALLRPYRATLIADDAWMDWIKSCVASNDVRFASHAVRTLIHLQRPLKKVLLNDNDEQGPKDESKPWRQVLGAALTTNHDNNKTSLTPSSARARYLDGIHLVTPPARFFQENVLPSPETPAPPPTSLVEPEVDIIFVHGLRGGAFKTWRMGGSEAISLADHVAIGPVGGPSENGDQDKKEPVSPPTPSSPSVAPAYTTAEHFWPSAWLARDLPRARILSLEYAAPATDGEGHTLPFDQVAARFLRKLVAAGVGQRPVIFITHSLGGLLVKEMLVQSSQSQSQSQTTTTTESTSTPTPNATSSSLSLSQLTEQTRGIVFYSCPHSGSWLADWGWYLKKIGGQPSKHIAQLRPGPHLDELNDTVRQLHKRRRIQVLSFLEGIRTQVNTGLRGYSVGIEVVPMESAYPGYGDLHVVEQASHITICKPTSREDPAYRMAVDFIRNVVRGEGGGRGKK